MKLPILLAALLAFFNASIQGQTGRSVEICGVSFHLELSRQEMQSKLSMQPFPADLMRILLGGEWVSLFPTMFGLPNSERCYGALHFTNGRIDGIRKERTSTSDAVALLQTLFLELRNVSEPNGAAATVWTWQDVKNEKDVQLIVQGVTFRIGEHVIQLKAVEGKIQDKKVGPITTVSVGLARVRTCNTNHRKLAGINRDSLVASQSK
jgi:hypothetical protein